MHAFRDLVLLALVAGAGGCGKSTEGKASAAASTAGSAVKATEPEKPTRKLPAQLPATFDDDARKAAFKMLEQPPVATEEVKDLHVPAGGMRLVTPIDPVNFVTYQYTSTARDHVGLAFLILLAEDGWAIEQWNASEGGSVMARIAKDNRDFDVIVGAPKGKEMTDGNLAVVMPIKPALGRRLDAPPKVKAPWNRDTRPTSGGKLMRTYGKLGYIVYNDNSVGWQPLEKLEPSRPAGPAPIDTCSVAVGDKVKSPFSRGTDVWPATIAEVHGGIARVVFDDKDTHWVECGRIRKR